MATRKGGLGKGLDSLIADKVGTSNEKTDAKNEVMVNINKVEPNKEQPRKNFDEDALLELSESIKQFGVLQPLLVVDRKDYYEIIAGERRWRAAKMAGLKKVPVIIKDLTEQEIVEISLIENIQRENLNPIEEAIAYKRLLNEFNLKQDEVAERVSKSRTAVTNSMRLLKLCDKVQQMVIDDMISTGHARALLGITDEEKQYTLAQKIFDEKISVRDTEKLVKKMQKQKFSVSMQHYTFAVKAFVEMVNEFGMDDYAFAIHETKTGTVIEHVKDFISEIGILYMSDFNRKILMKLIHESELEFIPLFDCNTYVYVWKKNPIASKSSVSLQ